MKNSSITSLKDELLSLLMSYPNARELVKKLQNGNKLYLFGGAVRNYLENGKKMCFESLPRDFDFVVKGTTKKKLDDIFTPYKYTKNRFDGYKIEADGLMFDVWRIEDTWAFKNTNISVKEENLCKTVFLNIDGVMYSFADNTFKDKLYQEAIKKRRLDVVLEKNPHIELNLLRAMLFKQKYHLEYSEKLLVLFLLSIKKCLGKKLFAQKLYETQNEHYQYKFMNLVDIRNEIDEIINQWNTFINYCNNDVNDSFNCKWIRYIDWKY